MSEKYIGVFDSGIGGLTVVKDILKLLPNENIVYFGDTAHLPYGTKSEKQIKEYAIADVNFLSKFDLKSLVIACNTADSVASPTLRSTFDYPIYGVIQPASKRAVNLSKNKRIGIMATNATVKSRAYQDAIAQYDPNAEVFALACPLLVPLVENGRYKKGDKVVELVVQEYLDELLKHDVDTIVLGCTHYPLLEEVVSSFAPNINVISSSEAAAYALKNGMEDNGLLEDNDKAVHRYFVSDDVEHFKATADLFFGGQLDGDFEEVRI